MSTSRRTLYFGGRIYSPVSPFATAMLVDEDSIAWLGDDSAVAAHRDSATHVVDLQGALVTPGFVDAHVHSTAAGLQLIGLDLSGVTGSAELLSYVAERAQANGIIYGHGWDDSTWKTSDVPTLEQLQRAAGGAHVYLPRIDVHSALVSASLLSLCDVHSDSSRVSGSVHEAIRPVAMSLVNTTYMESAQEAFLRGVASQGVVAVHEMTGPIIASAQDFQSLQAIATRVGVKTVGYWGELASEGGIEHAIELGCLGVGGDLFVDGSLGSHTAWLREPYADRNSIGAPYLDAGQIGDHLVRTTQAGMPSAFHVIGDGAAEAFEAGLRAAVEVIGVPAVRQAGHRLEHAEMLSDSQIAMLNDWSITASMQPMFDACWGGTDGLYEVRLGRERATSLNRFSDLYRAGVVLAFGSDAPVCQTNPWITVRAAMMHHQSGSRLSARSAFSAHTRGGWRAIGATDCGVLAPGAPAHFALWEVAELAVQSADERLSAWSTDERSGTPALPWLGDDQPLPRCLATIVDGRTIYDTGERTPVRV